MSDINSYTHEPGNDAPLQYVRKNIEIYQLLLSIDLPHKNLYTEQYIDGDVCAVDGKKRRIKIFYYCDEYAAY